MKLWINKIFSYFKNWFIKESLMDIEKHYLENYRYIIDSDYELNKYFKKLIENYDLNIIHKNLFIKKYDLLYRLLEYNIYNNISTALIRKIVFYKVLLDFKEFHYKNFLEFGLLNNIDHIDIMFIAKFQSKNGWIAAINKLGHLKIKGEFNDIDFLKLIIDVEKKIVLLEERYEIDKWLEITVKFV